jgi:hypothetical protein
MWSPLRRLIKKQKTYSVDKRRFFAARTTSMG